ncbi:MAG: Hsp20/alpha crystallin family protein [Pirellulaceae bacterium]
MATTLAERKSGNGVGTADPKREAVTYSPRFDIWETDDELVLYGDMPGVSPENLDIQYENGQILIHGHVTPRHDDIRFAYGEYGIGDYDRSFNVGEGIDEEKILAELNQGVLTLHLPKSERIKPRKIEVKSG